MDSSNGKTLRLMRPLGQDYFSVTSAITLAGITITYLADMIQNPQGRSLKSCFDLRIVLYVRILLLKLPGGKVADGNTKRCHAFIRFILTPIDQQSFTGLTVLILGYSLCCSITNYPFQYLVEVT